MRYIKFCLFKEIPMASKVVAISHAHYPVWQRCMYFRYRNSKTLLFPSLPSAMKSVLVTPCCEHSVQVNNYLQKDPAKPANGRLYRPNTGLSTVQIQSYTRQSYDQS